jgi:hypothetical protein
MASNFSKIVKGRPLSLAETDVLVERRRQQLPEPEESEEVCDGVHGEAYTARWDDDTNGDGELAQAAMVYAYGATLTDYTRQIMLQQAHAGRPTFAGERWPASWDFAHYKPTTPRRDLVKAGALILAEIERLDRKVERDATEAQEKLEATKAYEREYGGDFS